MNIKDIDKVIKSFKKNKMGTIITIIVFLFFLIVISYFSGFFSEKGKRHADSPKVNLVNKPASKEAQQTKHLKNSKIIQHTEGDQSPAVVSGGDVKINYDNKK